MANITINDIARLCGVSISTVSKALMDSPEISEVKRRYIRYVANEYNYVPNRMAKAIANQKTYNIGYVVPNIMNPYFAEVMEGIESVTSLKGYNIIVFNTQDSVTHEDEYLRSTLRGMVDGIIMVPAEDRVSPVSPAHTNTPIVLHGSLPDDTRFPIVGTNNLLGGYLATKHLIGLGHRSIAFVGGKVCCSFVEERLQGYRSALDEAGIAYDSDMVFFGNGYEGGRFFDIGEALKCGAKFTAVFCMNDFRAFKTIRTLREHGLSVPEDVSLVGFDDLIDVSDNLALTTVRQPKREIGVRLAEMLFKVMAGESVESERFDPVLIKRESTKAPVCAAS